MGMFGWLFRRTTPPSAASMMSGADAEKIIQAYGAAMESQKGVYADASELPYPKAKIKEALLIAIALQPDEKARNLLKTSYVALADWQEGIGPGPHNLDVADRPGETIQDNARRLHATAPAYMELSKKVIAEMQVLLAEVNSFELKVFKR
jgi:hypothetical protein